MDCRRAMEYRARILFKKPKENLKKIKKSKNCENDKLMLPMQCFSKYLE